MRDCDAILHRLTGVSGGCWQDGPSIAKPKIESFYNIVKLGEGAGRGERPRGRKPSETKNHHNSSPSPPIDACRPCNIK